MRRKQALALAILLLLLALLKLLLPGTPELLRAWAARELAPGAEERTEAMGRALAGGEEPVPALKRQGKP